MIFMIRLNRNPAEQVRDQLSWPKTNPICQLLRLNYGQPVGSGDLQGQIQGQIRPKEQKNHLRFLS